ncbi:MAG: hypothetical protein KJP25_08145 [Gammaproteobacteria bacterium]|nr:hypothetical protein [Gammaproteobacteria bacterium]MBT8151593.1 hypothetical protein [Gammaproteobacteria bacterium]NNM10355.1 hypothetical protein [Pseudomonadales bacterium]RZV52731.1 MAG: hypothetical protein EX270_09280 [Pseudomonadales bacterium]
MQNTFWYLNELGILLEIVGAVYIVLGSFRARGRIQMMFDGIRGLKQFMRIREILQEQAKMELYGFLFLSSGLILQFIAGFGN